MEDSGEGEGTGEKTDVTSGSSESTGGNEERGVGRADGVDTKGHRGESSTAQVPVDASQQVSGNSHCQLSFCILTAPAILKEGNLKT